MTATTVDHNSTRSQQFTQAVRDNRLAVAEELLGSFGSDLPEAAILPAAELHLRKRRFQQAVELFDRIPNLDIHGRLKRNSARNYASFQQHRPAEYERLIAASLNDRYRLVPIPGNRLSIADFKNPAAPKLLSPGNDPVTAVHQTLKQLEQRLMEGAAIGLVGIGDGFVLGTLAKIQPKLFMGMELSVHLYEPDLSLLHTCFMLHDFSGPQGPIEQQRFRWFVGNDWQQSFVAELSRDHMIPQPSVLVQQSTDRQSITPLFHEAIAGFDAREKSLMVQLKSHYASISAADFAARFEAAGSSDKPRVLFLTSRFTTVLQYATRGAAEGFRALGWDTKVLIEQSLHHRISKLTMIEAMAAFKPDLIFQIDHLRYEHEDVFPENLPFVTWIQDHLPHLTNANAGRHVSPRDYVLTFASPLFVDTYHYPARQCIDMPMMLTTPRSTAPLLMSDAPDLVYVSNVSRDPKSLEEMLVERAAPHLRPVMSQAIGRIMAEYEAGRSLATHHDLRLLFEDVCSKLSTHPPDRQTARTLLESLWNPLNITLFRQQALRWAASAADELGLSLGLYGRGWETHPDFAKYARGVIENGEPLAALTRSAKINLNLEPYACFTHQRLLDGLVAGGFFLIREHPGNTLLQELLNFLVDHVDDSVQTVDAARQSCPLDLRLALDDLLARSACLTFEENADPVRQVRCWQRAGVLIRQEASLPHLSEVSFHDEASCKEKMLEFMDKATRRTAISQAQRTSVEDRMSFAAGMKLITRQMVELLKTEGAPDIHLIPEAARC